MHNKNGHLTYIYTVCYILDARYSVYFIGQVGRYVKIIACLANAFKKYP